MVRRGARVDAQVWFEHKMTRFPEDKHKIVIISRDITQLREHRDTQAS